jgi:hypothetical protein
VTIGQTANDMIVQTATTTTSLGLFVLFAGIALNRASAFTHTAMRREQEQQRLFGEPTNSSGRRQQKTRSWPDSVVRLQLSSENAKVVADNTSPSSSSVELVMLMEKVEKLFPEGELLTMTLKDHRPLGCTVEESLNEDDDFVFISNVKEGGNADKLGLKVGDVVVGVTGLFGEVTIVIDCGVEKM